MKQTAYCKINLTLEILGTKRNDGFHDLKSIMHKIPLGDVIEIETEKGSGSLTLLCDTDLCDVKDNLAYRAAEAYLDKYMLNGGEKCDVTIKLIKVTPAGAGLGGGSADAATVLDMLHKMLGKVDDGEILQMAEKLGSDVPFCLERYMSAYCTGRGEKCESIQTLPKGTCIVVAKPLEGINTKGIYGEYDKLYGDDYDKSQTDGMIELLKEGKLGGISKKLVNDFECVCIPRLPAIDDIKKEMLKHGALGSQMSGSGSAVFGLFDDEAKCRDCFDALSKSGLTQVYAFVDDDFQKMYKGE